MIHHWLFDQLYGFRRTNFRRSNFRRSDHFPFWKWVSIALSYLMKCRISKKKWVEQIEDIVAVVWISLYYSSLSKHFSFSFSFCWFCICLLSILSEDSNFHFFSFFFAAFFAPLFIDKKCEKRQTERNKNYEKERKKERKKEKRMYRDKE